MRSNNGYSKKNVDKIGEGVAALDRPSGEIFLSSKGQWVYVHSSIYRIYIYIYIQGSMRNSLL